MNRYPNNCKVFRANSNIDNDKELKELLKDLRCGFQGFNLKLHNGVPGCESWEVEPPDHYNSYTIRIVVYGAQCAAECDVSQDAVFCELLKDMESLAARDELWMADFYALEEMNTLAIKLPAYMPTRCLRAAESAIQDVAGSHLNALRTQYIIRKKLAEYYESCGCFDVEISEITFTELNLVEASVKYKHLYLQPTEVTTRAVLVRSSDGYWNLGSGIGFERFKEN